MVQVAKGLVGLLVQPDHIQVHSYWVELPTKKKLQRLLGGVRQRCPEGSLVLAHRLGVDIGRWCHHSQFMHENTLSLLGGVCLTRHSSNAVTAP